MKIVHVLLITLVLVFTTNAFAGKLKLTTSKDDVVSGLLQKIIDDPELRATYETAVGRYKLRYLLAKTAEEKAKEANDYLVFESKISVMKVIKSRTESGHEIYIMKPVKNRNDFRIKATLISGNADEVREQATNFFQIGLVNDYPISSFGCENAEECGSDDCDPCDGDDPAVPIVIPALPDVIDEFDDWSTSAIEACVGGGFTGCAIVEYQTTFSNSGNPADDDLWVLSYYDNNGELQQGETFLKDMTK